MSLTRTLLARLIFSVVLTLLLGGAYLLAYHVIAVYFAPLSGGIG
jgi:hypothetical protein